MKNVKKKKKNEQKRSVPFHLQYIWIGFLIINQILKSYPFYS